MRARRAVGTWWSRCMMKRWLGSRLGLSEGERASNSVVLDCSELTERTERSCRGERSKCGTRGARTDVASGFGAEGGERGKQLYVSCEVSGRGAKQPTALATARPPAAAVHRPEGLFWGRCVQELARCRATAAAGATARQACRYEADTRRVRRGRAPPPGPSLVQHPSQHLCQ